MNTKNRLFKPVEPVEPSSGELVMLHLRPEYAELHEELREFEKLHAEKERELKVLFARNRGEKTKRSAMERAQDLLQGGRVDPTNIPDKIVAVKAELDILRTAVNEKTRALDVLANRISYEESLKEVDAFNADVVDAYQHLEQAAAAFQRAIDRPNRLRAAGYRPSPIVFADCEPYGSKLLRLSGLQQLRRDLESRGAL